MWTLMLSIAVLKTSGIATHTITIPNIPTRELCQAAGQEHTEKYTRQVNAIAKNMEDRKSVV